MPPTKVEWLDTIAANGYRVKKFRYEVDPGHVAPGPAVRARAAEWTRAGRSSTSTATKGDGKANSYIQERCINLAKKGMLAFNYEWFGMGQMAAPGTRTTG